VVFQLNFACHLLLLQVCPCICFCAYVEEQLQAMHDNAEVITARIVQEQQELQQQHEQQPPSSQQQHNQPLSNGNHTQDGTQPWQEPHQQQQHKRASQNGGSYGVDGSNGGSSTFRQQRVSDGAALAAVVAAASTKLRVLGRPIAEFSSCRREWVLKLGKAVAMGFMQKAAGAIGMGVDFLGRGVERWGSQSLSAAAAGGSGC
jgi:hypothetical protein